MHESEHEVRESRTVRNSRSQHRPYTRTAIERMPADEPITHLGMPLYEVWQHTSLARFDKIKVTIAIALAIHRPRSWRSGAARARRSARRVHLRFVTPTHLPECVTSHLVDSPCLSASLVCAGSRLFDMCGRAHLPVVRSAMPRGPQTCAACVGSERRGHRWRSALSAELPNPVRMRLWCKLPAAACCPGGEIR